MLMRKKAELMREEIALGKVVYEMEVNGPQGISFEAYKREYIRASNRLTKVGRMIRKITQLEDKVLSLGGV